MCPYCNSYHLIGKCEYAGESFLVDPVKVSERYLERCLDFLEEQSAINGCVTYLHMVCFDCRKTVDTIEFKKDIEIQA